MHDIRIRRDPPEQGHDITLVRRASGYQRPVQAPIGEADDRLVGRPRAADNLRHVRGQVGTSRDKSTFEELRDAPRRDCWPALPAEIPANSGAIHRHLGQAWGSAWSVCLDILGNGIDAGELKRRV